MRSYGQFCPVAKAAELFCERWTPLIVRELGSGALRFSDLQRGVPLMSPTLLSRRLKQLEAEGIVKRVRAASGARRYALTDAGAEFLPLVETLGIWGQRWSRRELVAGEIDLGLLIWSLEKSANATAFGDCRTVIQLTLTDQSPERRQWWFVNEDASCQLCLENPGYEIDLYLVTTLPDIIYVVRGDLTVERALDEQRLEAVGAGKVRRNLKRWLNLSPLAKVAPVGRGAAVQARQNPF